VQTFLVYPVNYTSTTSLVQLKLYEYSFYPPLLTTTRRILFWGVTYMGLSDCPSVGPSSEMIDLL